MRAYWLSMVLVGLTAGAMAQAPGGAPPAGSDQRTDGPRRGQRMAGPDIEGMLLRWLANDPKAAEQVGLTPDQVADLKKRVETVSAEMKDLNTKMEAAAKQQLELMSKDAPDEKDVMKAVEEIGELRIKVAKIRVHQLLDVQKSLTPEQRTKMRDLVKQRVDAAKDSWKPNRTEMRNRMMLNAPGAGQAPAAPATPPAPPPAPAPAL